MSTESLWAIIILLVGAHYANMVYRLHKAEDELAAIRKDFATAAIAAAQAIAQAAQATASVLRK